ncbi:MAG: hypothetical protein IPP90_21835 [Gemmatimonadaceae bacterium]|nr:hypothetical protein [Gemmatimonadaceae bacterium]
MYLPRGGGWGGGGSPHWWHFNPVDLIFNPILNTSYKGGLKNLAFVPSTRLAYNANSVWAFAVEEYADFGAVNNLQSGSNGSHQLYGVIDHGGKTWDVEVGVVNGRQTHAQADPGA